MDPTQAILEGVLEMVVVMGEEKDQLDQTNHY
jgi:hypothetical protein